MQERRRFKLGPRLQDRALRLLIWLLLRLPYGWRVPLCGWIVGRVIAPLAGYDRRVRENLARILPDLPEAEVSRLIRAVPDNVGRTLIEMYSGKEFVARATRHPLTGAGLGDLAEAAAARRPVIVVSGHFGNYDAARAALTQAGLSVRRPLPADEQSLLQRTLRRGDLADRRAALCPRQARHGRDDPFSARRAGCWAC